MKPKQAKEKKIKSKNQWNRKEEKNRKSTEKKWFFEKINKNDKPLARLKKDKEGRHKLMSGMKEGAFL